MIISNSKKILFFNILNPKINFYIKKIMMSNEVPLKSSQYPISPFKKVPNPIQIKSNYNFYNDSRKIFHPNSSQEKYLHAPLQLGVNVYFGQPKSGFFPHPMYQAHPQSQIIFHKIIKKIFLFAFSSKTL